ncbi:MAG: signal recognition particle protein [Candidatus Aminicenantes bacterium]|nr:signal recognition particle protein [Candidatus Aminicenantes bacterium]
MFNQLSDRLQKALKFIRGEVKVTEKNMEEALRMIRLAFLEADVNYKVVKDFIENIKIKALDQKVLTSLTPSQQVIKIVKEEMTSILGREEKTLQYSGTPPSIFMMVGLQGAGKTTSCGKLANWIRRTGKNPLLVSFDMKRPAAQEQLKTIADSLKLPFYEMKTGEGEDPSRLLSELKSHTRNHGYDLLIVDTAGRLHVDEKLMEELLLVRDILNPQEVIYVGDAMTGQDAVKSAEIFAEKIGITSILLTKLDGDARGGAALSIVSVTGKPIKFVGLGEKLEDFEVFHPDRLASRILGLGDMLTIIEKAETEADKEEAKELARKLRQQTFTLDDFKKQIAQMRKMGSISQILKMMPQAGAFRKISGLKVDDAKIDHFEAIINSMTPQEREYPKIINGSRRRRIANGSGRPISDVNQLLKQFHEIKKMMKKDRFHKMLSSFPLSH